MKNNLLLPLLILSVILSSLIFRPVFAQTGTIDPGVISATVDSNEVSTDDTIVLTISVDVKSAGVTQPVLPDLSGFTILGSNSGSQIQIINGDVSIRENYQYYLRPIQSGDFVIGSIFLDVLGTLYTTAPIPIRVNQGNGNVQSFPNSALPSLPNIPGFPLLPFPNIGTPQNNAPMDSSDAPSELIGQDFFVEAEVNNATPFVGQQVLYTLRFYQAVSTFGDIEYEEPSFTGFWHKNEEEEHVYLSQHSGRDYQVTERHSLLIPSLLGETTIDPAIITIPGDFFNPGQALATQPINLTVLPLPDNPPLTFKGAVGNFEIQSTVDRNQTVTNEPVSFTVSLKGSGNLDTLEMPVFEPGPEWRTFGGKEETHTIIENDQIAGERRITYTLIPIQEGSKILPPIEFSYFDPETGEYHIVQTAPIEVRVDPGEISSNQNSTDPQPDRVFTNAKNNLETIRPMKSAPIKWDLDTTPLPYRPEFWILWMVPFVMFFGQTGWHWCQNYRDRDPELRRSKAAKKKSILAIRRISAKEKNNSEKIGKFLYKYLSDRLNYPVSGMTMSELSEYLQTRGASEEMIERIQTLLAFSEMSKYAPIQDKPTPVDLNKECIDIIEELDAILIYDQTHDQKGGIQ